MAQFKTVFGLVGALIVPILVMPPAEAQDPPQEPIEESLLVFEAADDFVLIEGSGSTLIEVVANDDPVADDSAVTITIVTPPGLGTATVKSDGEDPVVQYKPDAGAAGVDTFVYEACEGTICSTATATVYVGTSGCTIVGTNKADKLVGTEGDDVICGRKGGDVIDALGGNDLVFGGPGRDIIYGGDGDDVLRGGRGNDTIDGGDGVDRIHGRRGHDTISGGVGDDVIRGGWGNDIIDGGDGADYVFGGRGNDTIDGGAGNDVLRGGRGEDTIDGGDGADKLFGGPGNDVIDGGAGDDTVRGRRGDDTITGRAGDDILFGNRGADTITGGEGTDTVNGGNGNDKCEGEILSACEDTPPVDVDPPVTDVVSVDTLDTNGELTLDLSAVDPSGIDAVVLVSPDGFTYEVDQVDAGNWSAVIDVDRLFPGDLYDFVFLVTDRAGNTTVTDTVSVTVPDRDTDTPAVELKFDQPKSLDEVVADLAGSGIQPTEFVNTWTVTEVAGLPPELQEVVAQNPEIASNFVGRPFIGVANVVGAPVGDIANLYESLFAEQGGVGSPMITAVRGIAPSANAANNLETLIGTTQQDLVAEESQSLRYSPDGEWGDEPFWPTKVDVYWGDAPLTTIKFVNPCYAPRGCPFNFLHQRERTFESRYFQGFISGLDTYFRPYFEEYGDHRAYELDVAQINLDLEQGDNTSWVQKFKKGFYEQLKALLDRTCAPDSSKEFPVDRHVLERVAGHDFASIEAYETLTEVSLELFMTNVNEEAGPYPDSYIGDDCAEMDLSLGIAKPGALDPDIDLIYYGMIAAKGDTDVAGLSLEHQSLDQFPNDGESGFLGHKAFLCESWSSGGTGFFLGVLGTNFCVGVVTDKTRSITLLANTDDPRTTKDVPLYDPPPTVPWMKMDFTDGAPSSACFEVATPPSLYETTTQWRETDEGGTTVDREIGTGLGWGLVNAGTGCSVALSDRSGFQIGGTQVLDPLETGEFYRSDLEMQGGEQVTWSVLENPILRYTDKREYLLGGLPAGLTLNSATGVISGTPKLGTESGPLYVTIGATGGDSTAVRQFMFASSAQEISARVSTTPNPVVANQTAVMRFTVTNQGTTVVSNARLLLTEDQYFSLGDALYGGANCVEQPGSPQHRCYLGTLAPGESTVVTIQGTINIPDWFEIGTWECTPAAAAATCSLGYGIVN